MSNISYDDFAKLDIRVAKIISTEPIPGKTKIIKGVIDIGNEQRNVIIGGAQYYNSEDIVGKISHNERTVRKCSRCNER
jgi:tRNA-binding protein